MMRANFILALMNALLVILLAFATSFCMAKSLRRNEAFIGYSELSSKPTACLDQLPDCETNSKDNYCLYDAFEMRQFCPSSCNLERCSTPGTHRITHKGFATREGTYTFKRGMELLHGLKPE